MANTLSLLPPAALFLSRRVLPLPVITLAVALLAAPSAPATENPCFRPVAEAMPLLEKMEQSWDAVTDYTTLLLKTERFVDGTITDERGLIKFRKPNQLYLYVVEGANEGAELLFPKPGTDSVILGRPGGVSGAVAGFLVKVPAIGSLIPYEFDLDEGRLMEGQHHPLTDSTLDGMMRLVSVNVRALARNREGSACVHPIELVDGKRVRRLELLAPGDAGTWHTVAEGETPWSIGADYGQDRYVILYNNPSIDDEKPLPVGHKIFVPRYYAPRAVIWVGEASKLPLKLQMFDGENRLYESYANTNLRIDVGLTDQDFDPVRHGFPAVTTADEKASAGEDGTR
jgi:hypothetical protein